MAATAPCWRARRKEQGAEVVVFCDDLCDWASAITPHVVALPMEPDLFLWPSTALHFSLNLLVQDVIDEIGDERHRPLEAALQGARHLRPSIAKIIRPAPA